MQHVHKLTDYFAIPDDYYYVDHDDEEEDGGGVEERDNLMKYKADVELKQNGH